MTEYATPSLVATATDANLCDYLVDAAEAGTPALFSRKVAGAWQDVSAGDFLSEATELAKGFLAWGLEPDDRVAIMSATRYEWTLCDFAIWLAGGVPVPIYETSSPDQVRWILRDAGVVGCVVETPAHAALLEGVRGDVPYVRSTWTIEDGDLDELVTAGKGVETALVDQRRRHAGPDTVATIIYTSGTTGTPKGCALTHANMRAEVDSVSSLLPYVFAGPGAATLLFLPLAHVFARLIQLGCVGTRTQLAHTSDARHLVDDLASFRPTFILGVPRVFEKVYNATEQKALASGRSKAFQAAVSTAIAWSEAQDSGGPSLRLRLRHGLFDALVYGKLRAAMGGRIHIAMSGGAPLGARLGHFFRGAGIPVLEGYGLTETSAASTANTLEAMRIGTVGRPIPGCALRIADDGEVFIKGPQVFAGYHGDPAATAQVLKDDWFATGDLGSLDADGFLTLTGRKKEILVTAGGKNVAPGPLEDGLRAHPLISQCIVVGDGRPYVAALITLDAEAVAFWLDLHGRPIVPVEDLVEDEKLRAELQTAIEAVNATVSHAEGIKRFTILPVDFTIESGHLTPSLKVKRSRVMADFGDAVNGIYG